MLSPFCVSLDKDATLLALLCMLYNLWLEARAMATRKKYSPELLEAAGERSVQAVLAKLGEEFGDLVSDVSVVCR